MENKDKIIRSDNGGGWIDVTEYDLRKLIKETYNLSQPQGLGALHYEKGELSEEEIDQILNFKQYDRIVVDMDYIKGRACKMTVFRIENKLKIRKDWLDHTPRQLEKLIERLDNDTSK